METKEVARAPRRVTTHAGIRSQTGISALSLRANFTWTFAGSVVYSGCQWAMLMVLAKLGTPATVGNFALALALTAPVYMFTNLQLRQAQATDANRVYAFGDYLGLRLLMSAGGLLFIAAVVVLTGYRGNVAILILAIGVAKALESVSDVFWGLYQQHERMDRLAVSTMIKGILALLALTFGMFLTRNVTWAAVGLAVAYAVTLIAYDIPNAALILSRSPGRAAGLPARSRSSLIPHWQFSTLWRLAWLTLPLGIVLSLLSLNYSVPRYFIQHDLGADNLGFFAAASYLMTAGGMVVGALGQSASPRLSQYFAEGRKEAFTSLVLKTVYLGAALGGAGVLVCAVLGHWALTVLYHPEYAAHSDVLVWLAVGAGVTYVGQFLGYALTAARFFGVQMPLSGLLLIVTAAGCFILTPRFGLVGAAYGVDIAAGVWLVASTAVFLRALRLRSFGQ